MSTSYLDLNGLGYLWDKAKDKFASKDISATDIEAVGISKVENEGNPVVISDVPYEQEAEDVIVEFEPIQDLHGYDYPWPEGGGKNLTDYITEYVPTVGINNEHMKLFDMILEAGTYTFSCKQSVSVPTSTRNTLSVIISGGTYQYEMVQLNYNPANLRHTQTFTITGKSVCSFYFWSHTPSVSATYNEWQVEKGSSFTGFAPYYNICPISGRTGVEVVRCRKNLCPINSLPVKAYWGYDEVSLKDALNILSVGQYTISVTYKIETLPGNGIVTHSRPYITALVGGTQIGLTPYSVKTDTSPTIGKEYTETVSFIITDENRDKINHCYLYCDQKDGHTGTERGTYSINNIQIELGSIATPYEPYQAETYDIEFPSEAGTVYGGMLDVKSGVLTVDRAIVDLGTLNWSGTEHFVNSSIPWQSSWARNKPAPFICSHYPTRAWTEIDGGAAKDKTVYFLAGSTYTQLRIYDSNYDNAADFKSAMSGVQLVYELATPITYQLTPHTLTLLKNNNYIKSSDSNSTINISYEGKSESTIQDELNELNEVAYLIKQSITNSQIDNMFDALDE